MTQAKKKERHGVHYLGTPETFHALEQSHVAVGPNRGLTRFYSRSDECVGKDEDKIDSPIGRMHYSRCLSTVEPPFGNIRHHKGMERFTLRGREKVDGQWKLYALVHNIEKLAHYGM